MSEEPVAYAGRSETPHFRDGQWTARYVSGEQMAVIVEDNAMGKTTTVPLTGRRARALIRLLTYMLEDAGERTTDLTKPWSEIRHRKNRPKIAPR